MIYLILFFLIIIVSLVLASRSMKSFQQMPQLSQSYALFLVRNTKAFNYEILTKLFSLSLNSHLIFSIEVLLKGNQKALALYAPSTFAASFPNLEPLEIEDYLEDRHVNDVYGWIIQTKNNPKKSLNVSPDFLNMVDLEENQKFFWQIVLSPVKNSQIEFQATLRAMVAEQDPIKKVNLAKKMDKEIETHTGLIKSSNSISTSSIFDSYKKRTLVPKEVTPNILQIKEIFALLGKLPH